MISEILNDKSKKPKEKTALLSSAVLDGTISVDTLLAFAETAKDSPKATCIEALEFATQQKPELADKAAFNFVTANLSAKAPRVKWESSKVIGNTAALHAKHLDDVINKLLINTEDSGTVVRWSAAFALGEILKLQTKHNKELLPAIESIVAREEQNSIKKIYLAALKKVK